MTKEGHGDFSKGAGGWGGGEGVLDTRVYTAAYHNFIFMYRDNVKEEGQSEVLKLASAINNRLIKHSQVSTPLSLIQ